MKFHFFADKKKRSKNTKGKKEKAITRKAKKPEPKLTDYEIIVEKYAEFLNTLEQLKKIKVVVIDQSVPSNIESERSNDLNSESEE